MVAILAYSDDNISPYLILLLDVATVRKLRELPIAENKEWGLPVPIIPSFSPDSRALCTNGGDSHNTVRLLDVTTAEEIRRFEGHRSWLWTAEFSRDGRTLLTAGSDGTARLWEVATGKERRCFKGGQGYVQCVAFSPDHKLVASGGSDGTAIVWDATGLLGDGPPKPSLAPKELDALWTDLASADAARAHGAIWALAAAKEAPKYLHERLRPTETPRPERIARLIADLDSDVFDRRQEAASESEKLGDLAEPALKEALKKQPSPESHRRLEKLLKGVDQSVVWLQALRAIEALEHVASPEAKQALQELAKGDAHLRRTREAQASLKRLK
jgi:hypothetical protein